MRLVQLCRLLLTGASGPINWVVLSQFALFYIVEGKESCGLSTRLTLAVALQMRIYAIYHRSRRLALFNGILFAGEITSMLILWWKSGCAFSGNLASLVSADLGFR